MDDIYLVEIRLARTKWRIRETIFTIARLFPIGRYMERHPHVTLFGPLTLNEGIGPDQLLDAIGRIAGRYDPLPFTIDGWETREGMHGSVIAFPVIPSDSLQKLTASIAEVLSPLVYSHNAWDAQPERKWFHVTVANRLDRKMASEIFSELAGREQDKSSRGIPAQMQLLLLRLRFWRKGRAVRPVILDETGLRISVMCGDVILAEYDLLEKRWITGDEIHDIRSWQKTLALFRKQSGFERTDPAPTSPDDIYLIADLHLGHANIIRYCSRPFLVTEVREMDDVLIKNWNSVISSKNPVYYLGDLRYGKDAFPARHYREELGGSVTFIEGNHNDRELGAVPSVTLECDGLRFLLIHDPSAAPAQFDGWVIHGHHHNNDLLHYPFIDFEHRRINVSAEVLGYVPVRLNDICALIHYRTSSGNLKSILLNYPHVT